jgi:hypothetical protein
MRHDACRAVVLLVAMVFCRIAAAHVPYLEGRSPYAAGE